MTRLLALAAAALVLLVTAVTAFAADPPATTLSGPSGQTADSTPTFSFTSSEAGATFECRLDDGPFTACQSPWTVQVADGPHTVAVRAIDEAGNVDPTPATRSFEVDTSGVDTTIAAGPDGLTNDPTPSFDFGSTTKGATFECRLDGAGSPLPAFSGCSSPLKLPALRSGAYTLVVRAVAPDGKRDGTPARRAFTVDADAPDTTVLAGPAEGGDSPDRQPRFTYASTEPGGFECRMDPRAKAGVELVAWASCGPEGFVPTPALSGGQHVFEVRAVDAAGNPDATPAKRTFRISACEQVVRFELAEVRGACLQGEGTPEAPVYVSEEGVTVNGLPVPAPGPSQVRITPPAEGTDGGGTVAVKDISLTVAGVELYKGDLTLKIPKGGPGAEAEVMSFPVAGKKLFGFALGGKATLRFGRRQGTDVRHGVLALNVALPDIFKNGTSKDAGSLSGDVAIKMDSATGVQLDGLKIAVGNAYVGSVGVKSLCLSFLRAGATAFEACKPPSIGGGANPKPYIECPANPAVDRWDGSLALKLPTGTEIGMWGGVAGGAFSYAGAYADKLGTAVPLAPGVFLDRVALGLCVGPPFKIKGGVGVGFGPDYKGTKAVQLSGNFAYTDAYQGAPWRVDADGAIAMFGIQLADGRFAYLSSGMVEFGFHAGFDFGKAATFDGRVDGWVQTGTPNFNVEGKVQVCNKTLGCIGADAVVSNKGVAGCANVDVLLGTVRAGAGYNFVSRKVDVMLTGCDIGPYRGVASRRQAGGTPLVPVGPDARGVVVRVRGEGGVPKVALVGPDGRRISLDVADGQGYVRTSHMIMSDEDNDAISVLVGDPAEGNWKVETLPGSVPLAGVDVADPLPPVKVSAKVTGTDRKRVLRYAYKPLAGQQIGFSEQGPRTARALGTAKAGRCKSAKLRRDGMLCGAIRFAPAMGGAGRRTIQAAVTQDDKPRANEDVATYAAPRDAMPGRPAISAKRKRGGVRVGWRPVAGATSVNVTIKTADGRSKLFTRPANRVGSVRLGRVSKRTRVVVAVRAVRVDGREGRPATRTVRAVKTKTRRKR